MNYLIEKYLGEASEMKYSKSVIKKLMNQKKGFVVFGTDGGVADEKVIEFTKDQVEKAIEKGKEDIIIKNVDMEVKNNREDAKFNKWKGRKFMVRMN